MTCSYIIYKLDKDKHIINDLQFQQSIFFNIILPAIMFPSGYNMRRRKFFRNIDSVAKFGFVTTLMCFGIYSFALYGLWSAGLIRKWDPVKNESVPLDLTPF
jgi:NhaP-type Na+/H+ or K+/H+ antiporter